MEIDSAGEGICLEFDSLFDEADLVSNQSTHVPSKQQRDTAGGNKTSTQENFELGASCGSNDQQPALLVNQATISPSDHHNQRENLTVVSAFTSSTSIITNQVILSDQPPLEINDPNMAPIGSTNNSPLMGTPQHENSLIKDIISDELEPSSGADCERPQLDDPQKQIINLEPTKLSHNGCESSVNAQNLQQLGSISSSNPALGGAISVPVYSPTLESGELRPSAAGSSTGNYNWLYIVNHADPNIDQNLMMQSSLQIHSSNPSIGINAPNNGARDDTKSSSNDTVLQIPIQNQMETSTAQVNGVNQSFGGENDIHEQLNMIYSYQYPNAYPENVTQLLEHLPLINNNQQQFLYLPNSLFPQNTMMSTAGVGVANQRPAHSAVQINNPQQAIFAPHLLNNIISNNDAYNRPASTNNYSPMGYWPQQLLSNQHQQLISQVPSMGNVVYDPNCQYSMQPPGFSTAPLRAQNISYHHQINHRVPVPATVYDPLVYNNAMMQPDHQLVPFNARPAQLSYPCQLINELPATHNSLIPAASMTSSFAIELRVPPPPPPPPLPPPLHDGQQLLNQISPAVPISVLNSQQYSMNSVNMAPNASNDIVIPHQRSFATSATTTEPSMPSRSQTENRRPQVLLNETIGPSSGNSGTNNSSADSRIRRPQNEQESGPNYQSTGVAAIFSNQKRAISPVKERGTILGRRGRRPHATKGQVGELPMSSKHSRREALIRKEIIRDSPALSVPHHKVIKFSTSHSEENYKKEASDSNVSRKVKNAVYDPSFEGIGLPIDPHLRLFSQPS